MAFLRSLFAGVSGLKNHQLMMDVIGNNIANVNTIGFKRSRATFSEMFSQTLQDASEPVGNAGGTNPIQVGLGMSLESVDTDFSQGSFQTTGISTDLAIQGSAFFIVNQGGQTLYTRDGSFTFDPTGKLVTGDGAVVQGRLADATGNIPAGTALQNIVINRDLTSPAKATTTVDLAGNLDASAAVGATASVSEPVFDSLGVQHTLTINFTKTADNAWSWTAAVPAPATTAATGTITFNSDGSLNSLTGSPLAITPGGGASAMSVTLDCGKPAAAAPGNTTGITQNAGSPTVTASSQDGYSAGTLNNVSVDSSGRLIGTFSNSQVLTLGQIMLANFNNPGGLLQVGNNDFNVSGNSGEATITSPGGSSTIQTGMLEQSNVDLADEFTKMITAQRGFQASARVITVSDQFLEEVGALTR